MSPYEAEYWREQANDLDMENQDLKAEIRRLNRQLGEALLTINDLKSALGTLCSNQNPTPNPTQGEPPITAKMPPIS